KIFPNKAFCKFFKDMGGESLRGRNRNKRIIFLLGEPNGGKSLVIAMMEKGFGEYMNKFDKQMFMLGAKASSAAARTDLVVGEKFEMKRFHADRDLVDKFDEYAPILMWIFFQSFIENKKKGFVEEPKEVMMASNEYKNDSDVYLKFKTEKLKKIEDKKLAPKY